MDDLTISDEAYAAFVKADDAARREGAGVIGGDRAGLRAAARIIAATHLAEIQRLTARIHAALALIDGHDDWCPGKVHADCCDGDCECRLGAIRRTLTGEQGGQE